ncbi:hypothetical protein [Rhodococcus wratislaviensis]|uniref:Uncharacterized protein n=1 Tax=Rhodococcus wratislaviensis NBRC 100605 TaxID=1219028 RepID=X0PMG2_RHOWR|nr:hypothetical protein [Rhodococcus wratislaviensis]GAF43643.1 hypothetical protein RW1_009_00670 [Rhodococcus wratislaviensis NBRC 100605]
MWGWSTQEWVDLPGGDQAEFRRDVPAWAGDEVRPYLAAHAYLLGSFTDFHRLGSFQRLTLVVADLLARPVPTQDGGHGTPATADSRKPACSSCSPRSHST